MFHVKHKTHINNVKLLINKYKTMWIYKFFSAVNNYICGKKVLTNIKNSIKNQENRVILSEIIPILWINFKKLINKNSLSTKLYS